METIIIHPSDEGQHEALLTILDGLGIPYEKKFQDETERILANPELVEKLQQSRKDMAENKGVAIEIENLWK